MTLIRLSVAEADGHVVVTFPGEIDASNAPAVRDRLLSLLNQGASPLIMDLTSTRFCDCAGAHAIIRADQRAIRLGTRICVVLPASGAARRLAELTGLPRRLLVTTSIDEAHDVLTRGLGRYAPVRRRSPVIAGVPPDPGQGTARVSGHAGGIERNVGSRP